LCGQKPRPGFAEAKGLVTASLHLLHHEDPEEHQKNQRTEIEEQANPVGVLHFFVVVENVLVLKGLGNIRDGSVRDRHPAEFVAVAIFALKFGAVRREVDGYVLDIPALHLRQEISIARLVLMGGWTARRCHLPEHDGQQDHQQPK
jgi:hypothetical protein